MLGVFVHSVLRFAALSFADQPGPAGLKDLEVWKRTPFHVGNKCNCNAGNGNTHQNEDRVLSQLRPNHPKLLIHADNFINGQQS